MATKQLEENLSIDLNQGLGSEEDFEFEMTDWYSGSVDPVHVGHYETQRAPPLAWPFPSEAMLEWTGKKWLDIDGKLVKRIAQWRGLKEPVA